MYRPDGNVIPAYSTWQPTEGKIVPIAKADQSATRRLVDPRGDLIRGKTIASTLLGVSGVLTLCREGPNRRRESIPRPATPILLAIVAQALRLTRLWSIPRPAGPSLLAIERQAPAWRSSGPSHSPAVINPPSGAVVGLFTRLRNRPDRPFWTNDSSRFQEMSLDGRNRNALNQLDYRLHSPRRETID
jgi:hypothetical protein